ncbi:MAG: hypothetical protein ACOYNS_04670 [Bacteroidota bacterium]
MNVMKEMKIYSILFKAEFKRFWSTGMLLLTVPLTLISLVTLGSVQTGNIKLLSTFIDSADIVVIFLSFIIFTAGIVGADVKSGWLRTLLTRSVTREQYVITKILVVFISILIVFLISFSVDLLVISFNSKMVLTYDIAQTAVVFLLKVMHLLLMVIISALISCVIPGSFNGYFVLAWYSFSQAIGFIVMRNYWDMKWAVVLQDYLFPGGFDDAKNAIMMQQSFPAAELLWGIAALMISFAWTLYSVNSIVVDTGSE